MRKLWLTTFTALYCAAGFTASAVLADPASMALSGRNNTQQATSSSWNWPWSKTTTTVAPPTVAPSPYVIGQPPRPQNTSFTHHPIDYLETNISQKFELGCEDGFGSAGDHAAGNGASSCGDCTGKANRTAIAGVLHLRCPNMRAAG